MVHRQYILFLREYMCTMNHVVGDPNINWEFSSCWHHYVDNFEDRYITLNKILVHLPINFQTSWSSVWRIVSDKLEFQKVGAQLVLHFFLWTQREEYCCNEVFLMNHIVTEDGVIILLLKQIHKANLENCEWCCTKKVKITRSTRKSDG